MMQTKGTRSVSGEVSRTDLEKLYRTYYMQVYSYVMTIVKNASSAEEITQQTFYKALTAKEKFRGGSGEYTWLCAIAKNLAFDELKRSSKSCGVPDEALPDKTDITSALEDKDATLRIHMVLHLLDEPYKEVFQLRVFGELSFCDIGRIFGKSENWARVTYHRAKLKKQEKMGEYHGK